MYSCPDCERTFDNSQSLNSHRRHCRLKREGKTWLDTLSEEGKNRIKENDLSRRKPRASCPICSGTVKDLESTYCSSKCFGLAQKKSPHTEETKKKISASLKGKEPSNKGKVKIDGNLVPLQPRNCPICGLLFSPKRLRSLCCSKPCASLHRVKTKKERGTNKSGGYREGSGRSKSGWYRGLFCGSTYELIFLVWFLENGTPVSRCQTVLEYEFEGKTHKYHPDFEVKNVLYEVKGYWTKQSEAKRDQHPEVVVMDKYDILSMKDECSLKGKSLSDLVALYEPRPHQVLFPASTAKQVVHG